MSASTSDLGNPYPKGKGYDTLQWLLAGHMLDLPTAYYELNVGALPARVSELRRLGWPINSTEAPHPKLKDEKVMRYSMDAHFLCWWRQKGKRHPKDYAPQAGRGRFAQEPTRADNARSKAAH